MPGSQISLKALEIEYLRELTRPNRRVFLPDHVARSLQNFKPSIVTAQADELHPILSDLVSRARERMDQDGISLSDRQEDPPSTLDSRERTRAEMLSVLLPYYAFTLHFSTNKFDEAIATAREAIGWARLSGNTRRQALAWNALAPFYEFQKDYEKEREAYRRALDIAEESVHDACLEVLFAQNLVSAFTARHQLVEASELLETTIQKARTKLSGEERSFTLHKLLLNQGMIASFRGDQGKALAILLEAEELAKKVGNLEDLTPILYHIGLAYRQLGDESRSLNSFLQMAELAANIGHQSGIVAAHTRIAESHIRLSDLESAEKALDVADLHMTHGNINSAVVKLKRIELYMLQGNFEEGLVRCVQLLDELVHQPVSHVLIAAHVQHGNLLLKLERMKEAECVFHRALQSAQKTEVKTNIARIKLLLARTLLAQNRDDEALSMLDNAIQAGNTDDEAIDVAQAWELKAEIAEKQELPSKALEFARIGHALALEVEERKAQDSLQKSRVLSEAALLRLEVVRERQERQAVEKTLAETLLAFEGKRHLLEKVEQRLKETLTFLENEQAQDVVDVLQETLIEFDTENGRGEHPLSYLDAIDQNFFLRLRSRWPDITRKQERLCGLIRARLTSHEIAEILNLSYEGMRTQRKRLRKRLGLAAHESLEGVIAEL